MGRTYRKPAASEALSQGDIFKKIPMPLLRFRHGVHLVFQGDGIFREEPVLDGIQAGMGFLADVELVDAIVLEQSCDTLHGDQVLLAPLRECDFSKRKTPKEKWEYIKRIGTSLAEPARIYLTNDPDLDFPRRFIDLGSKFPLTPEDLQHFIEKGHRVAALTDRGLINLQYRLTVQLSRVARDDIDWLSEEDLDIKAQVLTEEVKSKTNALATKRGQLAKAKTNEQKETLEADIEVTEEQRHHLEAELQVTNQALTRVRAEKEGQAAPRPTAVINGCPRLDLSEKIAVLQHGEFPLPTPPSGNSGIQAPHAGIPMLRQDSEVSASGVESSQPVTLPEVSQEPSGD